MWLPTMRSKLAGAPKRVAHQVQHVLAARREADRRSGGCVIGRKTNVVLYTFGYGGGSGEENASLRAADDAGVRVLRFETLSGPEGWRPPHPKTAVRGAVHLVRR